MNRQKAVNNFRGLINQTPTLCLIILLLTGCFPAAYNTYPISHWMVEHQDLPADKAGPKVIWHDTKKDGSPQTIGLHFGAGDVRPRRIFALDLGIIRTTLWWPLFHSMSIGIIGYPGLQFYHSFCPLGAKWDPTEEDYLWCSIAFRIHRISPVAIDNQAGS